MNPPASPADAPPACDVLLNPKSCRTATGGAVGTLFRPSQPGSLSNVSVFSAAIAPAADVIRRTIAVRSTCVSLLQPPLPLKFAIAMCSCDANRFEQQDR